MKRPGPALIVATLALFVALSGSTYAAVQINGSQIKNGTITKAKLAKPLQKQVAKAGPRGKRGPAGPMGPAGVGLSGPPGVPGAQGAPGERGGFDPSKLTRVTGPSVYVLPDEVETATAQCPAGHRATGGGYFSSITHPAGNIPGFASWAVIVSNGTSIGIEVNAYVVCAAP